jgi:beta-N-acetylhexosaminidase
VLDVHTNPRNPVIGDRALAERADTVARLGVRIIEALQRNGIAACGKHFPGHGDTSSDSHLELPLVEHPPDRLREVELAPFRAAIAAGVASIMTAHLLVPALDDTRPASLSHAVVTDLLRRELKFDGLIITDDLDMKGCAAQFPLPDAAVAACAAGSDIVLMCHPDHSRQYQALEALVHAVEQQTLPFAQIDESFRRQRRTKERFIDAEWRPLPSRTLRATLGADQHRAVAEEMSRC